MDVRRSVDDERWKMMDRADEKAVENVMPYLVMEEGFSGDPNFMSSLSRGLEVIQAFTQQRRSLSISQISQKTGIPRAAVRRCLYTLEKLGFVYAEENKSYALRPRVLALGHGYIANTPLASASKPVLSALSEKINESSSIAILDRNEILYIARASTTRIMTIDLHIGSRLPAAYTSMGRVLLANMEPDEAKKILEETKLIKYTDFTKNSIKEIWDELESVRRNGYAVVDQEMEVGLRSIAVPIKNRNGKVVASVNIGFHASRVPIDVAVNTFLPLLESAAQELSFLA